MNQAILVINAGSSSIKFSVFEAHQQQLKLALSGKWSGLGTTPKMAIYNELGHAQAEFATPLATSFTYENAISQLLSSLPTWSKGLEIRAVGHRVVHGGEDAAAACVIDDEGLERLERLVPLAPLHQSHNLAPIKLLRARAPDLPQVACFDTSFHRTQSALARAVGLPPEITEAGIHRYGFHGLSYEYLASIMPAVDASLQGRVVALHLGNGASMCAMRNGVSVATTMGFSTLDGLLMGTRCGSLDPGIVLYLMTTLGKSAQDIETLLYHRSGLLGISGVSSDMRILEASNDPRARFAVELFAYRIGCELGAMAATLGGLDAVVFTAGIGENSAQMRARVCDAAQWLGIDLDVAANAQHRQRISTTSSRASAWVLPTNEELMIARHVLAAV